MRARGLKLPLAEILLSKGLLDRRQFARLQRLRAALSGEEHRLGHFALLEKLGEGGMGTVYKVRDTRNGQLAALKILPANLARDAEYIERFEREARILMSLSHPNIVRALDFGRLDYMRTQLPYIAMELVEGGTLREEIERAGAVKERQALEWLGDVARALQCAHRSKLVHRDIKPDNIFIAKEGHAKLGDFGLARNVAETATRITQTGMFMGSVHYSSPEQAEDLKNIDIRSDIYSLGASFYHALTGQVPFEGDSAPSILVMHLTEELPWPGDVNPRVSDGASELIAKMMAKKREERFRNPIELLQALEELRTRRRARRYLRSTVASSVVRSKERRRQVLEKTELRRQRLARRSRPERARPEGRSRTAEAAPVSARPGKERLVAVVGLATLAAIVTCGLVWFALSGDRTRRPAGRKPRAGRPAPSGVDATTAGRPGAPKEEPAPPSEKGKAPSAEPSEGVAWERIFNGRDLTGWTQVGGKAYVEDGALVAEDGADLFYPADWIEFVLECEIRGEGGKSLVLGLAQRRMGRGQSRAQVEFCADGDVQAWAGGKRFAKCGQGRFPIDRWRKVRIELTQSGLKVHGGDELLINRGLAHAPAQGGGVYFYSFRDITARMRNARVRVIAPPP